MRRTGASYQADEETLKRLILLDGSTPPPPKTDAVDNGDATASSSSKEHRDKHRDLHHCLLPGCPIRESSGSRNLHCNARLRARSLLKRIRQGMRDITSHSAFDVVIVMLILLNTIVLALYHHGIHPEFRHILDYVNLVSGSTHRITGSVAYHNHEISGCFIPTFLACRRIFAFLVFHSCAERHESMFALPFSFSCHDCALPVHSFVIHFQ